MKSYKSFYPLIRRSFGSIEELSNVINRSASYCKSRLNGKKEFTVRERKMIADYIGTDFEKVTA